MSSYQGPASVVIVDGTKFDVAADLVVPEDPRPGELWFGTIQGDIDAFDLMNGDSTMLLPSGASSTFRPSRTDLVLPRGGVEITGTAPLTL